MLPWSEGWAPWTSRLRKMMTRRIPGSLRHCTSSSINGCGIRPGFRYPVGEKEKMRRCMAGLILVRPGDFWRRPYNLPGETTNASFVLTIVRTTILHTRARSRRTGNQRLEQKGRENKKGEIESMAKDTRVRWSRRKKWLYSDTKHGVDVCSDCLLLSRIPSIEMNGSSRL